MRTLLEYIRSALHVLGRMLLNRNEQGTFDPYPTKEQE